MANWIKLEKEHWCKSNHVDKLREFSKLINLDVYGYISELEIQKLPEPRTSLFSIYFHNADYSIRADYKTKEDMLHDWNRIEEKLGLKCA